jgi:hypothetical protein
MHPVAVSILKIKTPQFNILCHGAIGAYCACMQKLNMQKYTPLMQAGGGGGGICVGLHIAHTGENLSPNL